MVVQTWSIFPPMLGIILFGAGLICILRGWPRRRGSGPHCRKCDYLLIGNTSSRCPECGIAITPTTTVIGERAGRRGMFIGGIVIVFLIIAFVVTAIVETGDIQWYQSEPAYFVNRDLYSNYPGFQSKAASELIRRDQAGTLSAKYTDLLITEALRQQSQANPGPNASNLVVYLGQKFAAGGLSPQQKSQFLNQMMQASVRVRTPIAPGDRVPYRTTRSSHGPSSNFWVKISDGPTLVDGQVADPSGGGSSSTLSGIGSLGSDESTVAPQPPGHHILEIVQQIDICSGPFGPITAGNLLLHREEKLSASFDVLTTVPADYVTLTDDPTLATPIQGSIRLTGLTYGKDGDVNIDFDATNVPANVAFDVIVRINGREFPLGYIKFKKGETGGFRSGGGPILQPPANVDIILRSSETVARRTVDFNEIWKGEIVYPNASVTISGN